jgi:hypothetical protein
MMDDDAIKDVVTRLSRRHPSGGTVIERAAVVAEGADSKAILNWIAAHDGEPEAPAAAESVGGLHPGRLGGIAGTSARAARRYVLPPGTLS